MSDPQPSPPISPLPYPILPPSASTLIRTLYTKLSNNENVMLHLRNRVLSLESCRVNNGSLRVDVCGLESEVEMVTKRNRVLCDSNRVLREKEEEYINRIENLKSELIGSNVMKEKYEILNITNMSLMDKNNQLLEENESLVSKKVILENKIVELTNQIKILTNQSDEYKTISYNLTSKLDELNFKKEELQDIVNDNEDLKSKLKAKDIIINNLESDLTNIRNEYNRIISDFNILKSNYSIICINNGISNLDNLSIVKNYEGLKIKYLKLETDYNTLSKSLLEDSKIKEDFFTLYRDYEELVKEIKSLAAINSDLLSQIDNLKLSSESKCEDISRQNVCLKNELKNKDIFIFKNSKDMSTQFAFYEIKLNNFSILYNSVITFISNYLSSLTSTTNLNMYLDPLLFNGEFSILFNRCIEFLEIFNKERQDTLDVMKKYSELRIRCDTYEQILSEMYIDVSNILKIPN